MDQLFWTKTIEQKENYRTNTNLGVCFFQFAPIYCQREEFSTSNSRVYASPNPCHDFQQLLTIIFKVRQFLQNIYAELTHCKLFKLALIGLIIEHSFVSLFISNTMYILTKHCVGKSCCCTRLTKSGRTPYNSPKIEPA